MEAAGPSQPGARTILIGYDGSAHADYAIDEAARMFPGADAIVMTAWTSVRAVAGAGRAALPEAIRAEVGVAQAILRAAEESAVMSVVVGSRGLSGFRSALLGSVSNAVVQHSAKPVVVVHDPPDAGDH